MTRRQFILLAAAALAAGSCHAQQTLPLAGIAYAVIRVKDLAVSRTFYASLGFEEAGPAVPGCVLLKVNDRQYLRLQPPQTGSAPDLHDLGFEVADLEELHADYASHGLKPTDVANDTLGDPHFVLLGPMVKQPLAMPQTIEFLEYEAESRLSTGFGQHLGADRIADHLLAVSIACVRPDDAREFYLNDLEFKPLPGSPMLLHLPGNSGQYVAMVPAAEHGAQAHLVLETATLGRAERHLRREHIAFSRAVTNKEGGLEVFSFTDPDGNLILIQQR